MAEAIEQHSRIHAAAAITTNGGCMNRGLQIELEGVAYIRVWRWVRANEERSERFRLGPCRELRPKGVGMASKVLKEGRGGC